MSQINPQGPEPLPAQPDVAQPNRASGPARLWMPLVVAALFWTFFAIERRLDLTIAAGFFSIVGGSLLMGVLTLAWWFTNRRVRLADRFLGFFAVVLGGALSVVLGDKSVGVMGLLFFGLPAAITLVVLWLLATRRRSVAVQRWGSLILLALFCGYQTLIRVDGIDGDQNATVSWRWSRTPEEVYLAERSRSGKERRQAAPSGNPSRDMLALSPGDWPGFRGADRQSEVRGVNLATDWKSRPPKLVWRQRIGHGWSSVAVVGNRLFTQEQRGESEAVVCLDTATGGEIWAHEDPDARFSDGQAGPGPRSSPVFSEGRIYTVGATGILNRLNATTGELDWSRHFAAETKAPLPMWGFSSYPLVADGMVIVYVGAPGEKGLLAYRAENGTPAWSIPTGPVSYSSPQLVKLDNQSQVLFLSDRGLVAVNPSSGKIEWEFEKPANNMWRVAQPRQIGEKSLLIGSEDLGLVRIDVSRQGEAWKPAAVWTSRALRPAYNDFVYQDGFVYGFDEGIFACVDAETGKRRWKAGRYGRGQVLSLADQRLLLVTSEYGDVVVLAARPEKHEELGRIPAISGKTWNHPVIAHGCLFVRNGEEIACYRLPQLEGEPQSGGSKETGRPAVH